MFHRVCVCARVSVCARARVHGCVRVSAKSAYEFHPRLLRPAPTPAPPTSKSPFPPKRTCSRMILSPPLVLSLAPRLAPASACRPPPPHRGPLPSVVQQQVMHDKMPPARACFSRAAWACAPASLPPLWTIKSFWFAGGDESVYYVICDLYHLYLHY